MVHSEVYPNKYVVSIAPFSTPACPDCSQNITQTCSFLHVSLFNLSSIFPGGQLTPFAPMCGRPCQLSRTCRFVVLRPSSFFLKGGNSVKKTFRSWSNFFLVKIQNSTNFLQEAVKSKKVDPSGAFGHVPPPSTSSRLFLFPPYSGAIIIVIIVLLRHNGSKTYSSIHTHMDANTSTTNTQKYKNSKKEQNWPNTCDIRPTLLCRVSGFGIRCLHDFAYHSC